ncbi:MAG: response regulator [Candidatus Omnitrophica bacterium]|nr:response regulator [Candidatus Omnitrophota bacterium]
MSKILIVDDEPDILKILEKELSAEGYDVLKAATGLQSIDLAKQDTPDLILMDMILPDMGGAEAIKAMKNYPELKNVPVLFITAMVKLEEETDDPLKINIDNSWYDTIAKPFDREELLKKIKETLTA